MYSPQAEFQQGARSAWVEEEVLLLGVGPAVGE